MRIYPNYSNYNVAEIFIKVVYDIAKKFCLININIKYLLVLKIFSSLNINTLFSFVSIITESKSVSVSYPYGLFYNPLLRLCGLSSSFLRESISVQNWLQHLFFWQSRTTMIRKLDSIISLRPGDLYIHVCIAQR